MAVLISLFLALAFGNNAVFGLEFMDDSFQYSMYLDPAETYQLFWKYDDTEITFKVEVETTGYVGFGLSTNGGMKGADIVIGGVQSGITYFSDRHATGYMKPEKDPQQNWRLLFAEEDNTSTVLVFKRPLRSCDTENDLDIKRETMRLIWAYGPQDPGLGDTMSYHRSSRGSRSVHLLMDKLPRKSLLDDVLYFDVRAPEFTLPARPTTYWRTAFKIPELTEKHHIIGMEPLVDNPSLGVAHHMSLFVCTSTEIDDSMHGRSFDIFNQPPSMSSCEEVMFGWAIGGEAYFFPDYIGMPMGGNTKMKFVLLETHYDNPQSRSDIRDGSGMRIFYTPNLREQEGGMMMLGNVVSDELVIPPFADLFRTVGYCPSECTKRALANRPEGIKIFATILHSHLLGRKMRLRHLRNGTELPPIMSDENYDFNYQESRPLRQEVTVLPGDDLFIECDYGSKDRTEITTGGIGTEEEMCLAFIMYYPSMNFLTCQSQATLGQTLSFMDDVTVSNQRILSPRKFENGTLRDVLDTIDWRDSRNREKLEKATGSGRISNLCEVGDIRITQEVDSPEIQIPFVKPLQLCSVGHPREELQRGVPEQAPFSPQDFQHYTELDGENVVLFWSYDEDTIKFLVKAKTSGWVGFGLSPNGGMDNSDVVIGWKRDNYVHFSDRHTTVKGIPMEDKIQNAGLASVKESDGFTQMMFQRPFVSCDPMDRNITEGNLHLIWAYGEKDPEYPSRMQIHSNRGSKLVRLINGPLNPFVAMETADSMTTMEDGTVQIEFRNPDVPITSLDSTYYNVGFKFPELKEKYHIVKAEYIIQPGNEDFIFHIAMYGCPRAVLDSFHGRGFDTREEIVVEILQCSTFMGTTFENPPEYGFPVGGPDRPIKFVRLETLFSNPRGVAGLRDSSGLRLTLSPATRKQDIGFLRVGHSAEFGGSHVIPAGVKNFLVRGHCMTDCLGEGLRYNPNGITVTGVNLFSHKNATSIVLRHIRNGREIRPIMKEPKFDFYSQDMVVLQEPVQIQRGDSFVVDCQLDTRGASKVLTAGPLADDQPCLAILMYYPPIDLGICESASPPTEFLKVFDDFEYSGSPWSPEIQSPAEWRGKDYYQTLDTMDVSTEETKRALQRQMTHGNVSSFCFRRDQAPALLPNLPLTQPPSFISRPEPVLKCPDLFRRGSTPPIFRYTTPRDPSAPNDSSRSDVKSPSITVILTFIVMSFLSHHLNLIYSTLQGI